MSKKNVIRSRYDKAEALQCGVRSISAKINKVLANAQTRKDMKLTPDEHEMIRVMKIQKSELEVIRDRHFTVAGLCGEEYTEVA